MAWLSNWIKRLLGADPPPNVGLCQPGDWPPRRGGAKEQPEEPAEPVRHEPSFCGGVVVPLRRRDGSLSGSFLVSNAAVPGGLLVAQGRSRDRTEVDPDESYGGSD